LVALREALFVAFLLGLLRPGMDKGLSDFQPAIAVWMKDRNGT
jgi:hypothetical protein